MGFHFTLESLLRAREAVERQEELLLQAAQQEANRLRQALEECRRQQLALRRQQGEELHAGLSGAELQFTLARQAGLRQQERRWRQEYAAAEQKRLARQATYQQARRERRTLETLRDAQAATYEREQARRTQRGLDDAHLMRLARRGC